MEHEPLDLCSPFVTYLYNRKEDKRGCSLLVFQHTHKKTGGKLETDFDIFTLILLFPSSVFLCNCIVPFPHNDTF